MCAGLIPDVVFSPAEFTISGRWHPTMKQLCASHDTLQCVVTRRALVTGGGAVLAGGAITGLYSVGALDAAIRATGLRPVREPDHADTALLSRVRRHQSALLTAAETLARSDSSEALENVIETVASALNTLGGPTQSDGAVPDISDDLGVELDHAASMCADDAGRAHSAALTRTLSSMSVGLAQLAVIWERT